MYLRRTEGRMIDRGDYTQFLEDQLERVCSKLVIADGPLSLEVPPITGAALWLRGGSWTPL